MLILAAYFFYRYYQNRPEKMITTPSEYFKTTALHKAAEEGDLSACQTLLQKGADVNAWDEQGWSPLILAVQLHHTEVADFLLSNGAQMSYSYKREDTTEERKRQREMMGRFARMSERKEQMREMFKDTPEEIVDEILSDENLQSMDESMVDLHFAPTDEHAINHCNSLAMLKLLVKKHGADINHVGSDGYWPLAIFAENDDLEAVTWLLENGADPNTTSTGSTAIYKAIANDNLPMVKLLIKHGASVKVTDVDGCSPFFSCESLAMAKLLLDQGADPTVLDQADFPCWQFIDDQKAKAFLQAEAMKRGLKSWTELPWGDHDQIKQDLQITLNILTKHIKN